jgi:plasmid stabilization system protein ParE
LTLSFAEVARMEFDEAIEWYRSRNLVAAVDFVESVGRTIDLIDEDPSAWPTAGSAARRCRVLGFPYALIYEVRGQDVRVIAVAHDSRQPGFWRSRTGQ